MSVLKIQAGGFMYGFKFNY